MFLSDICNRHIVIRDVRDRDYNTSKANKPISYNIRHFIIKLTIHSIDLIIRLYETETFTCYTIDNSKSMYFILLLY